jgi:hypothetical protein
MLKHFKIKSSLKNYEIFFTSNFKIITKKNNCIVICDSFFKKTFYRKNFIDVKALDKNKSYDYVKKIFIHCFLFRKIIISGRKGIYLKYCWFISRLFLNFVLAAGT